jgi:hypothetical protein
MEERPTKVWGTHLKRKEREGDQMEATWEEFKTFMGNRYDSTDLVMAARQKLDHVYQGQESVEKYIERFITLLSDVETEYEICENDKTYMFLKGLNAHIRVACTINPQCSEVTRAMPRLRTSCGSPFRIMCRSFELRARLRVCACVFPHVILREASHYRMFMKCPKGCPLVILLVVRARASHRRAT